MVRSKRATSSCAILAVTFANDHRLAVLVHAAEEKTSRSLRGEDTTSHNKLVTTYDGTMTSSGFMFDISANSKIIIRGIDVNLYQHTKTSNIERILVYTKEGSYTSHAKDEDAWTLWFNDTVVAKGVGNPTSILSNFSPKPMSNGDTQSFYITTPHGRSMRYSSNEGNVPDFSNGDLTLNANGASKRVGFEGALVSPRIFNGAIHYETSLDPSTSNGFSWIRLGQPTLSPTPNPTRKPTTPHPTVATRRPTSRPTNR